jgi:hypothetical protein
MTNLYKCKECGRLVPIRSKGLCPACRETQRREQGETTMQTRVHTKKGGEELKGFFDRHIELLKKNPYSYESGRKISNSSRMNIAHLFPKRKYKSVACDDNNVVYLTWQEHTDFDYYVDTRDLEKLETFFPKTWMAMKKVLPLVVEQGKLYDFVENCIRDNE